MLIIFIRYTHVCHVSFFLSPHLFPTPSHTLTFQVLSATQVAQIVMRVTHQTIKQTTTKLTPTATTTRMRTQDQITIIRRFLQMLTTAVSVSLLSKLNVQIHFQEKVAIAAAAVQMNFNQNINFRKFHSYLILTKMLNIALVVRRRVPFQSLNQLHRQHTMRHSYR